METNFLTSSMTLLISIILPITLFIVNKEKIMSDMLFFLGLILYISFSTFNLLIFYISFESVIIPMIYLISRGSSSILYKYRALYRFTLYTIGGGLLLLIFLLICVLFIGDFNYYSLILSNKLSCNYQLILFPLLLITFLIKLPIIPFHIWLPDTHGEAPTSGSVILAALLLKLGGVGIIRWLIPILPYAYLYYRPLLLIIGLLSAIYASITTLRHIDIKKLIAYSSIAHIGLVLVGITSLSNIAYKGVILLLFSHGLVSSLLFLLIGFLYVRTNTRYVIYYKGLATTMPIFSTFLFISLILNAAIPPSLSFLAEFFIIQGTFYYETIGTSFLLLAVLFSGIYSLFLFCKICFSTLPYNNYSKYNDINLREFYIIIPLILFSFIFSFLF
jgi:proton-translocating NADH-quinone oxidoreductase chain M